MMAIKQKVNTTPRKINVTPERPVKVAINQGMALKCCDAHPGTAGPSNMASNPW